MPPIKRPKSRRSEEEHCEQVKFVKWFRLRFRDTRILAIPNGGDRNPIVAAKLKAEGVSSGVPDLYIPAWRIWIEMKRRKGGTLSPAQKDWKSYLETVGDTVLVCNGCEEARRMVMEVAR